MTDIGVLGVDAVFYFQIVIPVLDFNRGNQRCLRRHDHAGEQRQLSCFQDLGRKLLEC